MELFGERDVVVGQPVGCRRDARRKAGLELFTGIDGGSGPKSGYRLRAGLRPEGLPDTDSSTDTGKEAAHG